LARSCVTCIGGTVRRARGRGSARVEAGGDATPPRGWLRTPRSRHGLSGFVESHVVDGRGTRKSGKVGNREGELQEPVSKRWGRHSCLPVGRQECLPHQEPRSLAVSSDSASKVAQRAAKRISPLCRFSFSYPTLERWFLKRRMASSLGSAQVLARIFHHRDRRDRRGTSEERTYSHIRAFLKPAGCTSARE